MPYTFFLMQCFLIGLVAGCAVGPIFVLTFNAAACYGVLNGISVAIGAAFADAVLFYLGQIGLFGLMEQYKSLLFVIDSVGGAVLIGLGVRMISRGYSQHEMQTPAAGWFWGNIVKAFVPTVLNPLTLLFFAAIGLQVFSAQITQIPASVLGLGSCCVGFGSLTVLTGVSFVAARLGAMAKPAHLRMFTLLTGAVFFIAGCYLLTKGVHLLVG